MNTIETIGIAGAGAWGTALAINAARAGRRVRLWGRDQRAMAALRSSRINGRYLPDVVLAPSIEITADLDDLADADALLLVVPAQTIGDLSERLPASGQPLVICAKGLDRSSDQRLSEIIRGPHPRRPVAALSGPNFAGEVGRGLPAAATLACADEQLGRRLAAAMSHEQFRLYWTDDLIGVEIAGAVKNVLAIAAGIVIGRGLGENAKAALITRGLAELTRLGDALGARRETLMGLAGLGDLLLTAGSLTSRNMAFGHAVGKGADPLALLAGPGALVEGVFTARAVVRLATRAQRVEVPICRAVDAILDGRLLIDQALEGLMTRPLRSEHDG
jgi:glycerol-3-phosphate dehydrogenase (NAD(P)+)